MIRYLISQQLNILIFFTLILINSILNLWRIKNLKDVDVIYNSFPLVSILIPARNEEKNIEKCVRSILNQKYPNFELIVLNDNSIDKTFEILNRLKESYSNLKIINNVYLEENWLGKPNACQKLLEQSNGEIVIFLDADTFHKEDAILKAVSFLIQSKSDLVTIFPQEVVDSILEKLVIPFMNFALMSFYPLIPFANGQFMVYRKESLKNVGGFEKVRQEVLDDIKMANLFRLNKYKVTVLSGKDISFCKMYHDKKSLFQGFIKSYFAIFDYHLILSIFVFTYLIFSFFYPYIMFFLKYTNSINKINLNINFIILITSYLTFLITFLKFNYPLPYSILFQLTILLNSIIGYISIFFTITNKRVWKGRVLPKRKVKLL